MTQMAQKSQYKTNSSKHVHFIVSYLSDNYVTIYYDRGSCGSAAHWWPPPKWGRVKCCDRITMVSSSNVAGVNQPECLSPLV